MSTYIWKIIFLVGCIVQANVFAGTDPRDDGALPRVAVPSSAARIFGSQDAIVVGTTTEKFGPLSQQVDLARLAITPIPGTPYWRTYTPAESLIALGRIYALPAGISLLFCKWGEEALCTGALLYALLGGKNTVQHLFNIYSITHLPPEFFITRQQWEQEQGMPRVPPRSFIVAEGSQNNPLCGYPRRSLIARRLPVCDTVGNQQFYRSWTRGGLRRSFVRRMSLVVPILTVIGVPAYYEPSPTRYG